jgi:adenylate cyclase
MVSGQKRISEFFKTIGWSLIFWIAAAILFGFIRVWGIDSLPTFERVLPFSPFQFAIQMLVLGSAIGIPFGIMDYAMDMNRLRKLSYWKLILIKSIIQLFIAVFSLSMLVLSSNYVDEIKLSMINFIFSETSLLWLVYSGIVSFLIYFLQVVKTKIGGRVLTNLILGKYHQPKVETRIFMFLDMKDSTTHAENLGHIKFSSLIQDSINDLTAAIIQHKVEVYQYVGDEAVLTWKLKDGFENANCIQAYYTFMNTLKSRTLYYENKYGFVPFFKAGVHLGDVTVSEVGIIKREIAYHSDVLNTAARIQGKCNEFEAEVLISEDLSEKLRDQKIFSFKHIGGISLKGKQQVVNIYRTSLN